MTRCCPGCGRLLLRNFRPVRFGPLPPRPQYDGFLEERKKIPAWGAGDVATLLARSSLARLWNLVFNQFGGLQDTCRVFPHHEAASERRLAKFRSENLQIIIQDWKDVSPKMAD